MKHIIIIALLLTLVLASLRGGERREQHQRKGEHLREQRRHEVYDAESSVSDSYSGSLSNYDDSEKSGPSDYSEDETEYSGPQSYSKSDNEYSSPSNYSDDDDEYSGPSNSSDDEYSGPSNYSDDDSEYSGPSNYSDDDSEDNEYSGPSEYSESQDYSEQENIEEREHRFRQGRGPQRQREQRRERTQQQGWRQRRHNKDQNNRQDHRRPHPDPFVKDVFRNLKKTGKVILDEWNITEDHALKNEIRGAIIQNLETLLPIAEEQVDPVELTVTSEPQPPQRSRLDDRRHPPPPPKPEDEFANQVFETLHQIGFTIIEQWNVEQNVANKNQIRGDLIQQLGDLIPEQQVDQSTTILDLPIQLETIQPLPVIRMTEENGN